MRGITIELPEEAVASAVERVVREMVTEAGSLDKITLLSIPEAAKRMGIARSKLVAWATRHGVRPVNLDGQRSTKYRLSSLVEALDRAEGKGTTDGR